MRLLVLFSVGILLWPILEYLLHRYSGHVGRFPKIFYREHTTHHSKKDYFAPIWKKGVAAILFLGALTLVNHAWLDWMSSLVFSAGFISMYLFYEWTHYSLHMYAPKTHFGLKMRKHHFAHHFMNPVMNFGVTSKIIDRAIHTHEENERVGVPKKMAMRWLTGGDGQVKVSYQGDFYLK